MKKTTAIFFLLFLIVGQTGSLLLYCVQLRYLKNGMREEMKGGVQERFCDVIEDNAAIRWEEQGEEFSLNGDWYDVVAIKKHHGKTFFYCLNDRKEAQLVKTFASLMASRSAHGQSDPAVVKFHVTDQYILSGAPVPEPIPLAVRNYGSGPPACLPSTDKERVVPPPRW